MIDEQEEADLELPMEEPASSQLPKPVDPEVGDPPDAVRGSAQELVDAVGDAADDDTPRWDPRTVDAPSREGG